ncbi:MAG: hypothetical protein WA101_02080 [Minisyncoccia bacterium]
MFESSIILQLLLTYRYILLFPIACLEGPIVAIIAGFFIHLGYLSIFPSYLLLILGDFFIDTLLYYIGKSSNKPKIIEKYKSKSNFFSKNINHIKNLWDTHPVKTMFFSKLAYGFSIPLLVSAGATKLPYKKFAFSALTVSIFQYGVFLTIGYYFGRSYELMAKYVKFTGIIIGVIGVVFVIIYFLIRKYAQNKIIEIKE